jgi:formate hydrogenlyase subunit 3/multisubunit Na+/H+ antiporter MnhD subunit
MRKDVTIPSLMRSRRMSDVVRQGLAGAGVALLCLAVFAPALATAASPGAPVEERGVPFSMDDLGWIALVAMLLLVLAMTLQAIARHRRHGAAVQVVQRRTEA